MMPRRFSSVSAIRKFFARRWLHRAGALALGLALPLAIWVSGCGQTIRPPKDRPYEVRTMEVTGYCNCGKCCSWERSLLGIGPPVYSSGPNKGKRKEVGVTASGTTARYGTIAADTTKYPFGTIIEVPGYGYGRVEDRGGAIKGEKLDLWFPSHAAALKWGRKTVKVKVWKPR